MFSKGPVVVRPLNNSIIPYPYYPPDMNNGSIPAQFSSFAPYSPAIFHKPFNPHSHFGNPYRMPWLNGLHHPNMNPLMFPSFLNHYNPLLFSPQQPTSGEEKPISEQKPLQMHFNSQVSDLIKDPSLRPLPAAPIYLGTYRWNDYGKTHRVKPYPKAVPQKLSSSLSLPAPMRHQATPVVYTSGHQQNRPSFNSIRSNAHPPPGKHARLLQRSLPSLLSTKQPEGNPIFDPSTLISIQEPVIPTTDTPLGFVTTTGTQNLLKRDSVSVGHVRSIQDQELYDRFQEICLEMKGYRCDSVPPDLNIALNEKLSADSISNNSLSRDSVTFSSFNKTLEEESPDPFDDSFIGSS